ncbi:23S rRNA (guanosine(2251)-2'-O)-methyltransferase RlmB [uncultured Nitrospira sp.]|uniref:23S rRNA (guanosine(2251)-2'-O)-methyltransferase RlmB n=1 Tax=uncultured Nitrospira sp. TaxID=157176 RepID=UPI003140A1F3
MAPLAGNDEPTSVLYGFHAVTEALQSPARVIERLWLAKSDGRFFPLTRLAKDRHIPYSVESRDRLDRLAGDRHHQGVVASVAAKQFLDGEELLDEVEQGATPSLLVVLDQIQDPHNLGAIARSVDAAGGHGIVIPKHRAVGLTAGVAKASAGALEHVSVARVANPGKFLEQCQKRSIKTVALDAAAKISYDECDLTEPLALVFGSEGEGIRPIVLKKCDEHVRITMLGKINSLNVSVAVAVTLFEAARQRARKT